VVGRAGEGWGAHRKETGTTARVSNRLGAFIPTRPRNHDCHRRHTPVAGPASATAQTKHTRPRANATLPSSAHAFLPWLLAHLTR
jgi:hypothetical protein